MTRGTCLAGCVSPVERSWRRWRLTRSKTSGAVREAGPRWHLVAVVAAVVLSAACADESPERSSTAAFRPTASVQDIMLSIVDPAADAIWESVATIITHEGTEERRPRTDEDWEAVRHHAVRLLEASNLLLIEGRSVARPGFQSENPGIELEPAEVQALIDEDFETWRRHLDDLYGVAVAILDAVDKRDADLLFDEGGPLDVTCERCHQKYWYPDSAIRPQASAALSTAAPVAEDVSDAQPTTGPNGAIEGHVRLSGVLPGNPVIRMGVDPLCAQLTEGKQMVQEAVLTPPDGSLANVFVRLQGIFPETPVPDEPVVIDQTDCVFTPRVVGARAGQMVQIQNRDPLLHNLNAQSTSTNTFNVPSRCRGWSTSFGRSPRTGLLRIRCDLHRWMTEYIGVVAHPILRRD